MSRPPSTLIGRPPGARSRMVDPRGLRAATFALDPGPDIEAVELALGRPVPALATLPSTRRGFFISSGISMIATRGTAAHLDMSSETGEPWATSAAAEWLAGIPAEGDCPLPGIGPILVGALPFDPRQPGELVLPALAYVRAPDGSEWLTVVTPAGAPPLQGLERSDLPRARGPGRGTLASGRVLYADEKPFLRSVDRALAAIEDGLVRKVVLARHVDVEMPGNLSPAAVLQRLQALEPDCHSFAVVDDQSAFLGATPELLVSKRGSAVRTEPLAGTAGLNGDADSDRAAIEELLESAKDRMEHRMVVESIEAALSPLCEELVVPSQPGIRRFRSVAHLASTMTGALRGSRTSPSALDLVARLHPTPAVAGTPLLPALRLLGELEGGTRGRYSGPVGWCDSRGDGDFVVGIRSAEIRGETARMYAGAGIVDGSDPERELEETSSKLRSTLAALGVA